MGARPPRKTNRRIVPTVFCPRCDKGFTSDVSRVDAMQILRAHVRKAHKDDPNILDQLYD